MDSLGIYIAVPFCRSKCTYCNFASGVYSPALHQRYVTRLCAEIRSLRRKAALWSALIPERVDSIYLGGGTPSLLPPGLLGQIAQALRQEFDLLKTAEITLECAPGQLADTALEAMLEFGVNRMSFGVQSFVDREASATGRLHTRAIALSDLKRARSAGIGRISVDLIAGLPHQDAASWRESLDTLADAGARHASIYMLEVDEDSRLGRELLAGGTRYHASSVPSEDLTAALYESAISRLGEIGLNQYEISNFARPGCESLHNQKYWRRRPYLGFGLDAHSFLRCGNGSALRFAATADLEEYLAADEQILAELHKLSPAEELEEAWFLGLRLTEGINRSQLARIIAEIHDRQGGLATPEEALAPFLPVVDELCGLGLLLSEDDSVRLTRRGMMLSNEVFAHFLGIAGSPGPAV
jgi:oxygen-independent coproporphyrinogen III oxidase